MIFMFIKFNCVVCIIINLDDLTPIEVNVHFKFKGSREFPVSWIAYLGSVNVEGQCKRLILSLAVMHH